MSSATRAITQYFFDTVHFEKFLERVRAAGITIPIIPGVIPIGNFAQVKKFSAMCATSVPDWLEQKFAGLEEKPEERFKLAVEIATRQCRELLALGSRQLHFYTLNQAGAVSTICQRLGL